MQLVRRFANLKSSVAAMLAAAALGAQAQVNPVVLHNQPVARIDEVVATLTLPAQEFFFVARLQEGPATEPQRALVPAPQRAVVASRRHAPAAVAHASRAIAIPQLAALPRPAPSVQVAMVKPRPLVHRQVARHEAAGRLPVMAYRESELGQPPREVVAELLPRDGVPNATPAPLQLPSAPVANVSGKPVRPLALPAPAKLLALPLLRDVGPDVVAEPTLEARLTESYAELANLWFAPARAWAAMFTA